MSEQDVWMLIAAAVLLRIVWLFSVPNLSNDYARFIWDGRLSVAGHNPFGYTPAAVMKSVVPDFYPDPTLFEALNSQRYYTCYPPLLQGVFFVAAFIFPDNAYGDIIILRGFNLVADLGTLWLLILLCRRWKQDIRAVLLYALNPIVIAELTGNLHYEGMVIFFIVAAIYCWERQRFWMSTLFFTASVLTKLIPLILLPLAFFFWERKKGMQYVLSVLVLTGISFLPFFLNPLVIHNFWTSINSYFQESEFNASVYYLVRDAVERFTGENEIEIIGPLLSIISGIAIFVYAWWKRRNINTQSILKYFSWTVLIYYSFATTVFPWYITPLIAFAVFTRYAFPIVWSATIMLSYYANYNPSFQESSLLLELEYAVLLFAIVRDIYFESKVKLLQPAQNPK